MGLPQTPNPPHLYPQALQLKLYQAFIFSVPILFSIILFLLFYLFYLKRRASSLSSALPVLPTRLNQATSVSLPSFEVALKDKLPIIMFDEDLRASERDSQCCVCLGDFEFKEQLNQIPSCKHLFHIDCIQYWLQANTTCPLCRCSVLLTKKSQSEQLLPSNLPRQIEAEAEYHPQQQYSEQDIVGVTRNAIDFSNEEQSRQTEGSTSGRTCLTEPGDSQESSGSVVIQIGMHA